MPTPTKICSHCRTSKPATEKHFVTNLRNRDGLHEHCRACRPAILAERKRRKAERSREWARNNRDKVRESYQRSYEKNRRERLAYMREWRRQNKERVNQYQREYAARKSEATSTD